MAARELTDNACDAVPRGVEVIFSNALLFIYDWGLAAALLRAWHHVREIGDVVACSEWPVRADAT